MAVKKDTKASNFSAFADLAQSLSSQLSSGEVMTASQPAAEETPKQETKPAAPAEIEAKTVTETAKKQETKTKPAKETKPVGDVAGWAQKYKKKLTALGENPSSDLETATVITVRRILHTIFDECKTNTILINVKDLVDEIGEKENITRTMFAQALTDLKNNGEFITRSHGKGGTEITIVK